MPATPYFVRGVSLAAIVLQGADAGRIAAPGEPVTDIGVLTLPAGAAGNVFLHLGQKGDPIRLNLQGQNFHLAEEESTGVWVSVPAIIGAISVEFLVGLKSQIQPSV